MENISTNLKKNIGKNDIKLLQEKIKEIENQSGIQKAYNYLLRFEVSNEIRKPSLAIYDHTAHIIGGGQKYGFTMAHALKDLFDITIILNKEVTHSDIKKWYHLDLKKCKIKIISIPYFDQFDSIHLDPARITRKMENPFHAISKESGNYDFFINNSMNEMVYPLANISLMVCHFPERRAKSYFYSDRYTYVIFNSKYTAGWIKKKWGFDPHKHIYPPVDMGKNIGNNVFKKEKIVLSVARFESGGSKKQFEMVKAFIRLKNKYPDQLKEWKLCLVGGSQGENPYLDSLKSLLLEKKIDYIELFINVSGDKLKKLYCKAKIFWHLCGLDQTDPALVEHFGMTIVEAMQNKLVPIVFNGGGQKEIVDHKKSGFLINSIFELIDHTISLINKPDLLLNISNYALSQSAQFSREHFEKNVKDFLKKTLRDYKN